MVVAPRRLRYGLSATHPASPMALALFPQPRMETAAARTVLRILVADDDADMRLYLRSCLRTLSASGYGNVRILEAADGREALHLARAVLPDLIVSDLIMPGLDGEALGNALKADSRTAAIPILFTSGEATPPNGGDGFLPKPFNAARLRTEVLRLLRAPP